MNRGVLATRVVRLFSAAAAVASWSNGASLADAIHDHLTIDLNDFLSIFGRITAAH
jgi:hypothetical protein